MNAQTTNIYNCNVFELPKEHNRAGNLTAVNNGVEIPFEVKRVFYIYDIPSGVIRGAHAHKETYQYIIAASSSFDILLDDGCNKKIVHLDRPNFGLLVPPGIWCQLLNFSSAAICMVLTSHLYNESDYIREYSNYLSFKQCK
ncbi:MAG: FdtA/QdtA family cupin domain-containing protein [Bacteroides sp.]